jgi:DNA-binding NtrC family response regulator
MIKQLSNKRRILVVEDGPSEREALARMLRVERFEVITAASAEEALAQTDQSLDLVISDLRMLQQSGVDLLRAWRRQHPSMPFILLTAYGAIDAAVEAMKLGASDFLTKPVEPARLLSTIHQLLDASPGNAPSDRGISGFERIVGESPLILDACQRTLRAARSNSTVLLMGESGTGKELFAEAIHRHSARSQQPFVVVNMAAIPDSLVESELFGHVKGSFTGAAGARTGCFEAAHGGTLFIDEIGDFPQHVQAKLLRALESPTITPVGSEVERRVDVRVVAATSRPLLAMKNAGTFREDLYYRLNVLTLRMPPLRDRRQDIPLLVQHFLQPRAADGPRRSLLVSPELMQYLQSYDWPGNVRQLKNCVEWMRVMNSNGRLGLSDLPADLQPSVAAAVGAKSGRMNSLERAAIMEALDQFGGNRVHAARLLGISIRTLQRRLRDWGDSDAESPQTTEA